MPKILLVEDDVNLANTVKQALENERYKVDMSHSGREATGMLEAFEYDVVILDWQLPELSGIEICKQYRSHAGAAPILMLTGKREIEEKELGLDSGADDYLTKPFHMKELCARVRALLRRPTMLQSDVLRWGDVVVDTKTHKVTGDGEDVSLQPLEYSVLEFFFRHPGEVFSTEALLRRCWEADAEVSIDSLYVCIRKIRKKIDKAGQPSLIQTVHSLGYRLNAPEEQ